MLLLKEAIGTSQIAIAKLFEMFKTDPTDIAVASVLGDALIEVGNVAGTLLPYVARVFKEYVLCLKRDPMSVVSEWELHKGNEDRNVAEQQKKINEDPLIKVSNSRVFNLINDIVMSDVSTVKHEINSMLRNIHMPFSRTLTCPESREIFLRIQQIDNVSDTDDEELISSSHEEIMMLRRHAIAAERKAFADLIVAENALWKAMRRVSKSLVTKRSSGSTMAAELVMRIKELYKKERRVTNEQAIELYIKIQHERGLSSINPAISVRDALWRARFVPDTFINGRHGKFPSTASKMNWTLPA